MKSHDYDLCKMSDKVKATMEKMLSKCNGGEQGAHLMRSFLMMSAQFLAAFPEQCKSIPEKYNSEFKMYQGIHKMICDFEYPEDQENDN